MIFCFSHAPKRTVARSIKKGIGTQLSGYGGENGEKSNVRKFTLNKP
jgi:hypothetical protein